MSKIIKVLFMLLVSFSVFSQDITGKWKTFDEETGEEKSIVDIYINEGKVYGKISAIFNPKDEASLCEKCKGEKFNKPVLGMLIIDGLTKDDEVYEDGKILDPENGKEYTCKIWLDSNNSNVLNVRGYIAFFYRTQTWIRFKS